MLKDQLEMKLATKEDVSDLRQLVNAAYRELADMGFNFTGTYQDERVTKERMHGRHVFLLYDKENLVGTISCDPNRANAEKTLYLNQLAVAPEYKRKGIGSYLMELAENWAREQGFVKARLDTAQPAKHLVKYYQQLGYKIVDEVMWPGKTYASYILEKKL